MSIEIASEQPTLPRGDEPLDNYSCDNSIAAPLEENDGKFITPRSQSGISNTTAVSVRVILSEHYGTQVCRFSDAVRIVAILVIVAGSTLLISTQEDKLVDLSTFIKDLGFLGHIIFFLIFLWVGMPFGYSWSTTLLLVGFAYGWAGLVDANIGTVAGATLSAYCSRYCMRSCAQRLLANVSKKKGLYFMAVRKVIEEQRGGFLMLVILRIQPVQTFGLSNAFMGVFLNIPVWKYIVSTLIGHEHSIIMLTSIGILVRDVGSLSEATKSERGQVNLAVTIGVAVVGVIGCLLAARYLAIHVLPNMIAEDATVDLESDSAGKNSSIGRVPVSVGSVDDSQAAATSPSASGEDLAVPDFVPGALPAGARPVAAPSSPC